MSNRTDENYDQLARVLRESLGLDDQVYLDVIEALKRMKHRGYLEDYVIVPDAEMPDAEGKFVADERRIYIPASVMSGAQRRNPRSRYTVAHEIAHCALAHQHERKRGIAVSRAEWNHTRGDERDANRLAAALLAPSHRIEFTLKTQSLEVAATFGLSETTAEIRTKELAGIFGGRMA